MSLPVFVISARVHPGEAPASLVMHGLLSFLTSSHAKAAALRERAIIKLVPMLNPDGVFLGNYRCNSLGLDLNRLWHTPVAMIAPTIHKVRRSAHHCFHPSVNRKLFGHFRSTTIRTLDALSSTSFRFSPPLHAPPLLRCARCSSSTRGIPLAAFICLWTFTLTRRA